jgi:DNA-damage-inducible protein D
MEPEANSMLSGSYYWASHLLVKLGYREMDSFQAVIYKVARSLLILEIPFAHNLSSCINENTGRWDYRLSRFCCYLAIIYSDPKKDFIPRYKSKIMQKMGITTRDLFNVDRVGIREELSTTTQWLVGLANRSGVENYPSFIDSGYQGLYGMPKWKLAQKRNLRREANIQNWMNNTELALNLLRNALTEDLIRKRAVKGQVNLEQIHLGIGRELRNAFKRITNSYPEDLEISQNLSVIRKKFKEICRQING